MSWECPHYNDKICLLNGMECKPGKGKCVLKGRVEVISAKKIPKTGKRNRLESDAYPIKRS